MRPVAEQINARRRPAGQRPADRSDRPRPFVKWAGGKTQLLSQLLPLLPADFESCDTYVEPFVGGGAMLFAILDRFPNLKRVVINDVSGDVIRTYRAIRENCPTLIKCLAKLQSAYFELAHEEDRKAYYLTRRDIFNGKTLTDVERAASFIFLNRTCFNGLYRVNAAGAFNVPFGKAAHPTICDATLLAKDSMVLANVEIRNEDFSGLTEFAGRRSFFYFDPPYKPLNATSSFNAYAKGGFTDDDQRRLAAFCRAIDKKSTRWLLSNSDVAAANPLDDFFDRLYKGFVIERVHACRMVNADPAKRGNLTELAIRNYTETIGGVT